VTILGLAAEVEEAWRAWDRQPANVDRVLEFEDVLGRAVEHTGGTVSELRTRLAKARSNGSPYNVAVDRLGLPS
jgi:hypothetical protein